MTGWRRWATAVVLVALLAGGPAQAQPGGDYTVWLPIAARPGAVVSPVHTGIATYYDATGAGACSFDPVPGDLLVAALNAEEYDNAALCGAYVQVTGPKGQVMIRIVDLCPECLAGHLDLSREAFSLIADLPQGRVPITWQVVSPALPGPIAYHFKDGSNPWWTAVQIRNHRNPVARLEYRAAGGAWVTVPRTAYNYFVQTDPGMGPGPYAFRVTDIYGHVLTDSSVPHVENGTVLGAGQFPQAPSAGRSHSRLAPGHRGQPEGKGIAPAFRLPPTEYTGGGPGGTQRAAV